MSDGTKQDDGKLRVFSGNRGLEMAKRSAERAVGK